MCGGEKKHPRKLSELLENFEENLEMFEGVMANVIRALGDDFGFTAARNAERLGKKLVKAQRFELATKLVEGLDRVYKEVEEEFLEEHR